MTAIFSGLSKRYISICYGLKSGKSPIALENLYKDSTLNIAKAPSVPESNSTKFSGYIPIDKLKISHCRSSGPGGQHVNKVNTKVELRFHLESADWIPDLIRNSMKTKLRSSLTKDGHIYLVSDRTRSQHMNMADAMEKLRELIRSCEPVETPEPSQESLDIQRIRAERAARARLRQKREISNIKSRRGASSSDF